MKALRRAWNRLAASLRRTESRRDADLADEFEAHVSLLAERYRQRGMSASDAHRAALLKFGGLEPAKEKYRDQRGIPLLDSLRQDILYALRGMRQNPGFTAVVVLCLALGIGANAAMFTVINSVLLKPLPFKDSDRLVTILGLPRKSQKNFWEAPSVEAYEQIKADTAHFSDAVAVQNDVVSMTGGNEPCWADEIEVTGEFFPMLGVAPLRGRALTPTDARPGHDTVAVLSYKLWRSEFGGDDSALGKTIHLDAKSYVVIGVMPSVFNFPTYSDIWVPLSGAGMSAVDARRAQVRLTALLQPGVKLEQAQIALDTIAERLADSNPNKFKGKGLLASSVPHSRVQSVQKSLFLLFGAVGFVLLIACANVGNLFLGQSWKRQREFSVRAALGASRARLVRQLLVESVVVALFGGVIGIALAASCTGIVRSLAPVDIPRIEQVGMDWTVVLFTLGAAVTAGILFGIVPAIQLSLSRILPGLTSREFSKGATRSFAAIRLRDLLTAGEVALALVLLVGSTLAMRSFLSLLQINLGFRTDHLVTMRILPPRYKDPKGEKSFGTELEIARHVRALPGVDAATIKLHPFLAGFDLGSNFHTPGKPSPLDDVRVAIRYIDFDYFHALSIPLVSGRFFTPADDSSQNPIAIVNESYVKQRMENKNPLGEQLFEKGWGRLPDRLHTIVGEVADVRDEDVSHPPVPTVYVPFAQSPFLNDSAYLLVRTALPPALMVKSIEQQVWSIDGDIPVEQVETADQLIADLLAEPKFHALLLSAFASIGFTLALVGIYGVVSYSVGQRTREIGIRMALGAQRGRVLRMVLAGGMIPVWVGIAVGVGAALALARLIQSFLFGVKPTDPATFVAVALAFSAAALLACYQPARRATRVDPVIALRAE
ncbi:MAG TPA: ABC transporter permease [Candidatus Acidoferrales bacterium]|nr:ABC transporter permease [Candidatus Acidoferrales bacterium]